MYNQLAAVLRVSSSEECGIGTNGVERRYLVSLFNCHYELIIAQGTSSAAYMAGCSQDKMQCYRSRPDRCLLHLAFKASYSVIAIKDGKSGEFLKFVRELK